jgi:outer membrane receptor protein involved in Fe transport
VTLEPADGHWTLSAYARNLEDERHKSSPPQVATTGPALSVYSAPLTYGLRFGYKF